MGQPSEAPSAPPQNEGAKLNAYDASIKAEFDEGLRVNRDGTQVLAYKNTGLDALQKDNENSQARTAADKLLKGLRTLAASDLPQDHKNNQKTVVEGKLGVAIDLDDLSDPKNYESLVSNIDQAHLDSLFAATKKAEVGTGMAGSSEISRTLAYMANPNYANEATAQKPDAGSPAIAINEESK